MQELTPEQKKDIEERVNKAQAFLKELNLYPSAIVQKINMGDDVFADKILCYLADNKYIKTEIKSSYPKI